MNDLLLQQIEKISLVQHNRNLIHALCGLDLEILRTDGSPLRSGNGKRSKYRGPKSETTSSASTSNGSQIKYLPPHVLALLQETHAAQTFIDSDEFHKIAIPIMINGNMVGVVYTGENQLFRFKNGQLQEITKILTSFTEYIVNNELTPLDINFYANGEITRQQELLNRAVRYIKQNYHSNDLTLREVSSNNGISYHYLSRIFKKELDTTFAQYRNKVRMDAAKKMLKNRRLSVSQISFACGFDDPAYFCKVFKNSFGMSPTNYRSQHYSKSKA